MPLISEIRQDVETDLKAARKIRIGWSLGLCLIVLGVLSAWVLDHAGRLNLEFPLIVSASALSFTIAVKWKLRSNAWFWIAMAVFTALHIPLFVFVPWTSGWIPALAMAGAASIDFVVMLSVLDLLARFVKRRGRYKSF